MLQINISMLTQEYYKKHTAGKTYAFRITFLAQRDNSFACF